MTEGHMEILMRRRGIPDGRRPRSPRRRTGWGLPGAALLLAAIIATSVAACGSGASASEDTTTTGATGQTGPQGQFSGGNGGPFAGGPFSTADATTTTTGAPTTTTVPAPTTTTTLAEGSYSDGIYLVGTDIPSGLYKGTVDGDAADSAHWEITTDANGERYYAGGDPVGQFYVRVYAGYYLRLTGVTIASAPTTAADPLLSSDIGDGTYRVGYDLAAGWHQGTVNDTMGYWEVSSDANGQTLVANDYAMAPFTVKVKTGQYITLRGVTLDLSE
jgi:hypothetical protein